MTKDFILIAMLNVVRTQTSANLNMENKQYSQYSHSQYSQNTVNTVNSKNNKLSLYTILDCSGYTDQ